MSIFKSFLVILKHVLFNQGGYGVVGGSGTGVGGGGGFGMGYGGGGVGGGYGQWSGGANPWLNFNVSPEEAARRKAAVEKRDREKKGKGGRSATLLTNRSGTTSVNKTSDLSRSILTTNDGFSLLGR